MNDVRTATREISHSICIDLQCCRFVLFSPIHIGIGSTIDNQINTFFAHKTAYCCFIGDVQRMDGNGAVFRNNNIAEYILV